jgi:amidohydrolase
VILTGIGLPDDRLHAPNEKVDLKQLWDGINVFQRFYELLGSDGGKPRRGSRRSKQPR